jgi:hypothetical protein
MPLKVFILHVESLNTVAHAESVLRLECLWSGHWPGTDVILTSCWARAAEVRLRAIRTMYFAFPCERIHIALIWAQIGALLCDFELRMLLACSCYSSVFTFVSYISFREHTTHTSPKMTKVRDPVFAVIEYISSLGLFLFHFIPFMCPCSSLSTSINRRLTISVGHNISICDLKSVLYAVLVVTHDRTVIRTTGHTEYVLPLLFTCS